MRKSKKTTTAVKKKLAQRFLNVSRLKIFFFLKSKMVFFNRAPNMFVDACLDSEDSGYEVTPHVPILLLVAWRIS